jgi:cellulose synthase (UDP-forming)
MFYYLSWWFAGSRLYNPWLLLLFVGAVAYSVVQLLGNWTLHLLADIHKRAEPGPIPAGLSVDVFLTANGEEVALVERALSAVIAMRLPHCTWLLDDGADPNLAQLAARLGAGYLTRNGRADAKAGNLNAALARTDGDIVVIFDIDHAPLPDFLEQSLGFFADAKVGFVQVMLTFENNADGRVAKAAADSSLEFYNSISVGSGVLGSATLIGSNALIRRRALESIDGYRPGLAEDLATSVALHAAGWRSVYVHEPLAPGYAPSDLNAWFIQQAKWARGVFELLLTTYPRKFRQITWQQRLIYAVRMTYYWIGLIIAAHLLVTLVVLFTGSETAVQTLESYLRHLLPLGVITVGVRQLVLRQQGHRSIPSQHMLKSLSLIYMTWPVYTLAWLMAVLRIPLRFRPTPKGPSEAVRLTWLLPQLIMFILLIGGLAAALPAIVRASAWLMLAYVIAQAIGQLLPYFFLSKSKLGNGVRIPVVTNLHAFISALGRK